MTLLGKKMIPGPRLGVHQVVAGYQHKSTQVSDEGLPRKRRTQGHQIIQEFYWAAKKGPFGTQCAGL